MEKPKGQRFHHRKFTQNQKISDGQGIQKKRSETLQVIFSAINGVAALGTLGLAFVTWQTGESVKAVKTEMAKNLEKEEVRRLEALATKDKEIVAREQRLAKLDSDFRLAQIQNAKMLVSSYEIQQDISGFSQQLSTQDRQLSQAKTDREAIISSSRSAAIENRILQESNRSLKRSEINANWRLRKIDIRAAIETLFFRNDLRRDPLSNMVRNGEDFIDADFEIKSIVLGNVNAIENREGNPMFAEVVSVVNSQCRGVYSENFYFGSADSLASDRPAKTKGETEEDARQAALKLKDEERTRTTGIPTLTFGRMRRSLNRSIGDEPNRYSVIQDIRFNRVDFEVEATTERIVDCVLDFYDLKRRSPDLD